MRVRTISRVRPTNCGHCSPERTSASSNARFIARVFAHSGVRAQHPARAQRPKKYQSRACKGPQESAWKQRFSRIKSDARSTVSGQRHDAANVARYGPVSLW